MELRVPPPAPFMATWQERRGDGVHFDSSSFTAMSSSSNPKLCGGPKDRCPEDPPASLASGALQCHESPATMRPDVTDVESLQYLDEEHGLRINHFIVPVITMEALILMCLGLLAYYLRFTEEFPVFNRPVFCNDESLKFPLDNESALFKINSRILYSISFLLPPISIVIGEIGYWIFSSKPRKIVRVHCSNCKITLTTRRLLRFIGTFLLGAFCTSILTDGIKLMAGRPRPYFLTICDPYNNSCGTSPVIIENDDCSVNEPSLIRTARLSFPSFYASLSSYAAVYTMIYFHNLLRMHGTYALRPLLILIIGGLSLLCGFSQLMTYRNHWEDVLAGYILGSAIAAYFGVLLMNTFQEHKPKQKQIDPLIAPRPEDNSRFFRWFWIPRISFGKTSARTYRGVFSNGGQGSKGPFGPNPAFQQDLHQRIENFGRKQKKQHEPSSENRVLEESRNEDRNPHDDSIE